MNPTNNTKAIELAKAVLQQAHDSEDSFGITPNPIPTTAEAATLLADLFIALAGLENLFQAPSMETALQALVAEAREVAAAGEGEPA